MESNTFEEKSLLEELQALRAELQLERSKRLQLEEECDLLSTENVRLHEMVRLRKENNDSNDISSNMEKIVLSSPDPFLQDGDGNFSSTQQIMIPTACNGKNVTCAVFLNLESDDTIYIVCGGADNSLRLYGTENAQQLSAIETTAPILSMDSVGSVVACSCMDGSHYLINFSTLGNPAVSYFKDHSKYAVCIRMSGDGEYVAVASHDQSVSLYCCKDISNPVLVSTIRLPVTPEAVIFVPTSANGSNWDLVIAVRDRPHLIYVNCITREQREITLNENDWDTHVSFTPLHLSLSPDMKYLLVATNRGQHLIYSLETNKRVRILASHECNDYGKPSTAWDPTGKYIYSLSDGGFKVFIYSLATERVVDYLIGHHGAVRSVVCHARTRQVVTASFDKSNPTRKVNSQLNANTNAVKEEAVLKNIVPSKPITEQPYDSNTPVIIGIAGGSSSGKTTLTNAIMDILGKGNVSCISHDSYYKDLRNLTMEERDKVNFDHPNSLDTALLRQHLILLKAGKSVNVPIYDFKTHGRSNEVMTVYPSRIIIVDGILLFADSSLLDLMDMKIYVDTEDDVRLIRRINRDTTERSRSVASVMEQYISTVRPMHQMFVEPSKSKADIIVPATKGIQSVAVDMCVSRLREIMNSHNTSITPTSETPS